MVHNNKILTVSYGTFSCTLEGFEDSFDTMKAIAEYFRDLAADDRYFGAEPPQPDAEMLAKIAEREIARQVQAHRNGDGFVLRAADTQSTAAVTAPAPEPAQPVAAAPVAAVAPAPVPDQPITEAVEEAPAEETPVEVAEVDETPADAPAESIADKLQRIRAVVSRNEASKSTDFTEDQHAEAFVSSVAEEMTAALDEDIAEDDPTEEAADADLAAAFAAVDAMAEDEVDPADTAETALQEDTVSEEEPTLAEVEEEPEQLPEAEEVSSLQTGEDEPEAQDDLEPEQPEQVAEAEEVAQTEDDAETDAEPDVAVTEVVAALPDVDEAYEDDDTAGQDDVLSILSSVQNAAQEDAPAQDDSDAKTETVAAEDTTAEDTSDPETGDELDLSAFLITETAPEDTEDQPAEAVADEADEEMIDILEDGEDGEEPRLVRISKSELEAAIAAGEIEEVAEDETRNAADEELSPEDEADLMRELAEVEAEQSAEAEVADDPARMLAEDETDEDVSRLMAAAEEKMGAPESSANRETYSQMRAAVAVAEAEKSAGGSVDDGEGVDAYREDLASVVRPRRPVANGAAERSERPEAADARPAPLTLVAEQRIDLDDDARADSRGPVRPRRISADHSGMPAEAAEPGTGGFADFASEMGATELPDLLEAAAAYLSFVEGRDQFSRPQLMNKVRQLESHEFNREDGLRSFGQLLREGKIEKTGGGRFTASGDIGYRPDERAAG